MFQRLCSSITASIRPDRLSRLGFVIAMAIIVAGSVKDSNAQDTASEQADTEESAPAVKDPQPSSGDLRVTALRALQRGDNKAATEAADQLMKRWPDEPGLIRSAGDVYLRAGKYDEATKLFNRYVKKEPQETPGLWQRGISLYFSGDHDEAVKQFEVHRTVNPNDVENAAWHFLCVAKAKSVDQAKQLVLPAPNDPRVPMQEVLEMLPTGDTKAVEDRVKEIKENTAARASAEFYGDFYLGLYADALGKPAEALRSMKRSAKNAPHHYMGDVARVYAKFLEDAAK